ncbi:MAG: NAD(+) kinase [Pseudomonadota bacterium]
MDRFHKIGIIGKYADNTVSETLHALSDFLKAQDVDLLLDDATAEFWPDHTLPTGSRDQLGRECDLIIVVGGDGTFLNAARSLSRHDPALLGLNLGRLGFLTDISPNEMTERIEAILAGRFNEEERFLLHCRILRDGEQISESDAFNDVVVHKWDVARMIEVDTFINGTYVNTLRSDGLIVSTPTGSTAYALSGGGPILQPCLNAVILVPICPHTMSNRPIVVDADTVIEIVVKGQEQSHAQVSCDGQINLGLVAGDRIQIRKKAHTVRLIHPVEHDHFHILREKLHWG